MRKTFGHHYQPTSAELRSIWTKAVIAIDANVLLNLYRYSEPTRVDLISSLRQVEPQVFLPHQAGEEFFRNRLGEMARQVARFDKAMKELAEAKRSLWGLYRAPVREHKDRQSQLDSAFSELEGYLQKSREGAPPPTADPEKDPVLKEVTRLLDGRVGATPSSDQRLDWHQRAETRFAEGIPPGYKDADKEGTRKYGDVVLWFQLLAKAEEAALPVILLTDDGKATGGQPKESSRLDLAPNSSLK
jgi:hypothetical protein